MTDNAIDSPQHEYHVASFVAHAIDSRTEAVCTAIGKIPGGQVHAVSPTGKIVFTLEENSQSKIGKHIDQLRAHTGLLSLSPVYHQFLTEPALNQ